MKYSLTIKPYAESQEGDLITIFNIKQWSMIVNLYKKMIINIKKIYNNININYLENNDIIKIEFFCLANNKKYFEELKSLICGINLENVIDIDNTEYYIRANIIYLKYRKINSLEKINIIARELYI